MFRNLRFHGLYWLCGNLIVIFATVAEESTLHLHPILRPNANYNKYQDAPNKNLFLQSLIGAANLANNFAYTTSANYTHLILRNGAPGENFENTVRNAVPEPASNGKKNGNFEIVNEWKYLDFEYPTYALRQQAIGSRHFIPENNLPLGIDVYDHRIFITTPRWKDGVPASLGCLPYPPNERSPPIRPYPDWKAHSNVQQPDCSKLISVYRTSIDSCGRLWAIDSGIVNATVNLNQICAPKIVAFDLNTDKWIVRFNLPQNQIKQDSLHSNILTEIRNDQCDDAYVYVTDVWRFGLVVFSLAKNRSWRVTNYNFSPNPIASDFNVYGLNFQWLDGVFGISLSMNHQQFEITGGESVLYFHPMASFKEFAVSTELLRNESLWSSNFQQVAKHFIEVGDRGYLGQSSASHIARNGVMFYTQVHRDNIGCWDTTKPYVRSNLAMLLSERQPLVQFPNDLKVDQAPEQSVWVMSNRLPIYLYSQLNYSEINFRILKSGVNDIISGGVCDPNTQETHFKIPVTMQLHEGQCY